VAEKGRRESAPFHLPRGLCEKRRHLPEEQVAGEWVGDGVVAGVRRGQTVRSPLGGAAGKSGGYLGGQGRMTAFPGGRLGRLFLTQPPCR
jgi:hypothetical protein